jgi:hypothetical protein
MTLSPIVDDEQEHRLHRLAELVMHLTGCSAEQAVVAVRASRPATLDDLSCVAQAMVVVRS